MFKTAIMHSQKSGNLSFTTLPVYDQGSYSEKLTVHNNNMNMLLHVPVFDGFGVSLPDVRILVSASEIKQRLEYGGLRTKMHFRLSFPLFMLECDISLVLASIKG